MTESRFQAKIIKEYENRGYFVVKLIMTNKTGIPDLLCIKGNHHVFIEVKAGSKVSKLQQWRHKEMRSYGLNVKVLIYNEY